MHCNRSFWSKFIRQVQNKSRRPRFLVVTVTKAEMGIKLSEIDPLIRIKKKNSKFFWGKNLYKEKLPKIVFLAVFGGHLVLFFNNGSYYSPEMLHLSWSGVDKHVKEKKFFGLGPQDAQNGQKSQKILYTLLFWRV